jgi:hypothetical protein
LLICNGWNKNDWTGAPWSKQQPTGLEGKEKEPRHGEEDTAGQASEQKALPYDFYFSTEILKPALRKLKW